jgi:hypothetical protein
MRATGAQIGGSVRVTADEGGLRSVERSVPTPGCPAGYALGGYQVQVAPVAVIAASSGGSPEAAQHAGLSMPWVAPKSSGTNQLRSAGAVPMRWRVDSEKCWSWVLAVAWFYGRQASTSSPIAAAVWSWPRPSSWRRSRQVARSVTAVSWASLRRRVAGGSVVRAGA